MKPILALCVLLATAVTAFAQTQPPKTALPNTPFKVAADHDGANTDLYQLWVNGVADATAPRSALINGVIEINVPAGLAVGIYTLTMTAHGPGGGSPESEPLTLIVGTPPKPAPPTNIRVGDD